MGEKDVSDVLEHRERRNVVFVALFGVICCVLLIGMLLYPVEVVTLPKLMSDVSGSLLYELFNPPRYIWNLLLLPMLAAAGGIATVMIALLCPTLCAIGAVALGYCLWVVGLTIVALTFADGFPFVCITLFSAVFLFPLCWRCVSRRR